MESATIPAIPDTHCPPWCPRDHEGQWRQSVESCRELAAEGLHRDPAARFEPLHSLTVLDLDLGHNESVTLDLQVGDDEDDLLLYFSGQGALNAEQARKIAAALIDGADQLDQGPPRGAHPT